MYNVGRFDSGTGNKHHRMQVAEQTITKRWTPEKIFTTSILAFFCSNNNYYSKSCNNLRTCFTDNGTKFLSPIRIKLSFFRMNMLRILIFYSPTNMIRAGSVSFSPLIQSIVKQAHLILNPWLSHSTGIGKKHATQTIAIEIIHME